MSLNDKATSIKILAPIGVQDLLVFISVFTLLVVQMPGFADDPGVGWHLKTGEWIVKNFQIPYHDPFLYSSTSRMWVADQWLSDVLLYLFHTLGAWPTLYAFLTVVFLWTFLAFLYFGISHITGKCLLSSFAVLIAFKASQLHFILRPVMFSFVFFCLVYVLIYNLYRELAQKESRADFEKKLKHLFLILPVIFMLWANMHPAFVYGLILVLILPVSIVCDRVILRREYKNIDLSFLFLLFATCFVATVLNPYLLELHRSIFKLGGNKFFMNFHMEWNSPNFKDFEGSLFEISMGVIVLSALLTKSFGGQFRFFPVIGLLTFSHLALQSVRSLPFYVIFASIPFIQASAAFASLPIFKVGPGEWILERLSNLEQREQRSHRGLVVLIILCMLIVSDSVVNQRVLLYKGPWGPSATRYPYEAMEYLTNISSSEPEIVVAAPSAWGGFITLFGDESIKAVLDDRNTLLGEKAYRDYLDRMRIDRKWNEYLKELGATYLLLPVDSSLGQFIIESGRLYPVFKDNISLLFDLRSET